MPKAKYKKPHIPPFHKLVIAAKERAGRVLEEEVKRFADEEQQAFVQRIDKQEFPSFDAQPLSPRYAAWKKKKGLDERVMIATGWYIENIKVWKRKESGTRRTAFFVGFHKRVQARDHKGRIVPVLLSTVARVHEHGSVKMNVPARPHWGPQYKEMVKRAVPVRERIRARLVALFKKRMGMKT